MSLAQSWKTFLSGPKLNALSEDATLTYVTSCKQFKGQKEIVKQLQINTEGFKSIKDEVTSTHEADGVLVNEIAASFILEFDGKSNPLLPGIDDNMYSGRKVEVPMIYIVTFNGDTIQSIRVFWDQATVLKQIEVIGARGRGWPVFDGAEQNRLLKQAIKPEASFKAQPARSNARPANATRDPHATLHLQEVPVEERGDYGPQDYHPPTKPATRDYGELFVNDDSARPDELTQRAGESRQRQVTLGQSQYEPERGIRQMNINEARGHRLNNSHFEFGTPDPAASDLLKNEMPAHNKGAIRDHNRSTEDDDFQHFQTKPRPDLVSNLDFSTQSPTPATHNAGRRGPPTASYDAFDDTKLAETGEKYNLGRRPPPQSSFDLGDTEQEIPKPQSRAASARFNRSEEEKVNLDIHGRDGFNKARRPPPQSSFDLGDSDESPQQPQSRAASHQFRQSEQADTIDIHGRDGYNKGRRPPPQSSFDIGDFDDTAPQQPMSRAASNQFRQSVQAETVDIHGRDGYNKARRPPPQSSFDIGDDSAPEQPQSRAASARFNRSDEADTFDIHGRDGYNKGRHAPPQSQYDFLSDVSDRNDNFGRQSQRNFTPSYDLGDPDQNIHGREYNMSRRGPPAPSSNFLG